MADGWRLAAGRVSKEAVPQRGREAERQRGAKQGVSSLFDPAVVQKAAERLRKRINTPEWGRAEFAGLVRTVERKGAFRQ